MARLDGDLNVTGNISAANYPPPDSGGGGREIATITGDGKKRVFFLTHTLGVKEVQVSVYTFDWKLCIARVVLQSIGNFAVTFANPPGLNEVFNIVVTK